MKLTRKQKLAIESLKNLAPEDIAQRLNTTEPEILEYLKNRGHVALGPQASSTLGNGTPDISSSLFKEVCKFWSENKLKILLIVILGFLIYTSALPAGFVSDDLPLLKALNLKNATAQTMKEPVNAIINSLTYTLNYFINGANPWGYHLVNILFHVILTLIAYFFLCLLTKERIAFLASLLFLVMPLHAEPVIWVSGRHYILYSIFVLLSLILHLFATQPKAPGRYRLWSVIFFVCAVYSFPEQGLVLPFLLVLIDFYQGQLRQRAKHYWPYLLLAVIFAVLSLSRVALRIQDVNGNATPLLSPQINFILADIVALSTYVQLFFIPVGLTFYHETIPTDIGEIIIRALVLIILIGPSLLLIKKNRFFLLAVGIFLITLLPTITPFRVSWIVAERYAYLAALGLAMLTAYFINLAIEKFKPNPTVKYLVAAVILAYAAITFMRGFDWKNEDTLWLATIKTSPTSSKALNNIGDYYGRHGEVQKSFDSFVKATQINPTYSDAWHNAGNVLLQNGKFKESIPYFEKSVQFNPNLIEGYNNMAIAYAKLGELNKAHELINKSLTINPNAIKTYNALAQIEYESGNTEKAKEAILQGLQIDPSNPTLKQILDFLQKQKQQLP